jgi:GxxExxY protein
MELENKLAKLLFEKSLLAHKAFGPGIFESVYEEVLSHELRKCGIAFERQKKIDVFYDGLFLDKCFYADLIIENTLLVEIKSVKSIEPVFLKQDLTYLRLTELKLGVLINFNEVLLKDGFRRVINTPNYHL